MTYKRIVGRFLMLVSQFGLDPLRFIRSVRGLPSFTRDWRKFRQDYAGPLDLVPCLHDRFEEGGSTKGEYFWQDLLVARWIHKAKPVRHVDIGSRVDGFVAHVASFREIEVFDVRPITTAIPGVTFRQADLMDGTAVAPWIAGGGGGYCDSLSCLHALEHFGLGRYGDPIDPRGYEAGFANLASLLKPGGRFYLSTPIGRERVEFNANWVFDPRTILRCADTQGLRLERLAVFNPRSGLRHIDQVHHDQTVEELAAQPYNLGIFVFTKPTGRAA